MVYLKYGKVKLKMIDGYDITKSSQEVTFNSVKCDFTEHTAEDLPERYQEVKIVEEKEFYSNGIRKTTDSLLFVGYVDDYNFGEMREKDVDVDIEITLLSPMKKATLRTCIAVGTYQLKELIEKNVLVPLIDDGYEIKVLDIDDRQVTVNFLVETVEYCMRSLSNKYNFWWYIDEKKNIYVKNIETMFNKSPDHIYDLNHSIAGLEYIKPITNSEDYANVINFKNVRIYEISILNMNGSTIIDTHNPLISKQINSIKKEGQLDFNFPVDVNKKNIQKSMKSNGIYGEGYGLYIKGKYSTGSSFEFYIKVDLGGNYIVSDNVGYDGNNDNKEFLLIRDSFFSNLITGFKYNGENKTISSIEIIKSDSALIYNINKFYNDKGILAKRDVVGKSGIVELTIDMNESWKTIQELTEIGSSYLNKNSIDYADEIEMKLENDTLNVGDIIYINRFFIDGKYVVIEEKRTVFNNDEEFVIKCKSANMLSSFIDVFRQEDTQTNSDKTYQLYVTHYEEEGLDERIEVEQ